MIKHGVIKWAPVYTDYGEELSVTLSWSSRKTDEADDSRRRPFFLSTKHTLSTPSISLDSGGDVPAAHCSSFARPSILQDTNTTSTLGGRGLPYNTDTVMKLGR